MQRERESMVEGCHVTSHLMTTHDARRSPRTKLVATAWPCLAASPMHRCAATPGLKPGATAATCDSPRCS
jgi:hypothetical protein